MVNYYEILQAAREFLKKHGIADADTDAWYLLSHVTGMNRADFFMHSREAVPKEQSTIYEDLVYKRAEHIPLQYLTGYQEFMGLKFEVNENVLIPRQDTECLVEEVLKVCGHKSVLDLCTGSGCIIISLAKLGNLKSAAASDLSGSALNVAYKNAVKNGVEIEFILSDLFENINGVYDIIVSNPPYIKTDDIAALMPEVRDHEPISALDGKGDGLSFYRRIIGELPMHIKSGGFCFFEIGCDQGLQVKRLLEERGFGDIRIKKDLAGMDRVVRARKEKSNC